MKHCLPSLFSLVLFSALLQPIPRAEAALWNRPSDGKPEETASVLETSGEGRVKVDAKQGEATVSIIDEESTLEAVNQTVSKRSQTLLAFLNGGKARNVQTETISIEPRYEFANGVQHQNGFQGRIAVHFEADLSDIGDLISEALRNGASETNGFTAKIDDKDLSAAREQAIQLAVQDALWKSNTALHAAGLTQKRICHLSVDMEGQIIHPMPIAFRSMAAVAARPNMAVQSGTQDVTATVQITVEFAPQ